MVTANSAPSELTVYDLPGVFLSGTARRRQLVALRKTDATAGMHIDLGKYIPDISDIEGIMWSSDDSAANTDLQWSVGTVSVVSAGVLEAGFIINLK